MFCLLRKSWQVAIAPRDSFSGQCLNLAEALKCMDRDQAMRNSLLSVM